MSKSQFSSVCDGLASLLSYPRSDYMLILSRELAAARPNSEASEALNRFHSALSLLSIAEVQELYTQTFDLSPMCSPSLSVHLFGVESFKRSHLMVGLLDLYSKSGYEARSEGADHMATLIGFLPTAADKDREELIAYVTVPALDKMRDFLNSKSNPFANLLCAASCTLSSEVRKESQYA